MPPGRYKEALRTEDTLGWFSYSGEMRPQSGLIWLKFQPVFSTPQSGIVVGSVWFLSTTDVTDKASRPCPWVPLRLKEVGLMVDFTTLARA